MHFFFQFFMVALLYSCATATKQTDKLVKDHAALPLKSKILNVPLVKQENNHCGPSAMTMVLDYKGVKVSEEKLTEEMFTEKLQGTFQADMLNAARYKGMVTIPIDHMESLIKEVSESHPVIVFQNLGFSWKPVWHYAVVTGHDLKGPDVYLHTGDEQYKKTDMRFFERSWKLGGYWGLLVLRPDELSVSGDEKSHIAAAAALERIDKNSEAKVHYLTVLKKWPQSLGAYIGLGNVAYSEKAFLDSANYLKQATLYHPLSATAWHNLATVQGEIGRINEAKKSSKKAIELADESLRPQYLKSLARFL